MEFYFKNLPLISETTMFSNAKRTFNTGYRGEAKPANLEAKPPPYWQNSFAAAAAAAASATTTSMATSSSVMSSAVSSQSEPHLVDAIKTDVSSSPVNLVPSTAYYITEPQAAAVLEPEPHPEPAIICGN